ncbi:MULTISPECIES: hypothetical protein [unclassified Microbacterium]|uniref:hypothetical protein n=1 Tax=unclassified Microbacterium TaxID=2609290 RepID=UPI00301738EA
MVVRETADNHPVEAGETGGRRLVPQSHAPVDDLDDALAPSGSVEERRRVHQLPISVRTV